MAQELIIIQVKGEHRIDSCLVAQPLGVEYESFIRMLRTHQTKLEELGIFRFQIGKIGGRGLLFAQTTSK